MIEVSVSPSEPETVEDARQLLRAACIEMDWSLLEDALEAIVDLVEEQRPVSASGGAE